MKKRFALVVALFVTILSSIILAGSVEAANLIVYNSSAPTQTPYFVVNGTTGFSGIGKANPTDSLYIRTPLNGDPTSGPGILALENVNGNVYRFYGSTGQSALFFGTPGLRLAAFGQDGSVALGGLSGDSLPGSAGFILNGSTDFLSIGTGSNPTQRLTLGSGNISLTSGFITGVSNPLVSSDVATKAYVDALNASAGTSDDWNLTGNNLFPKSLSYNVGIGVNNPQSKLQVVGSSLSTGANLYAVWSPDGNSLQRNWALNDNSTGWSISSATVQYVPDGPISSYVVRSPASTQVHVTGSHWIPIDQNKTYRVSVWARSGGAGTPDLNYLSIRTANASFDYPEGNGGWGQPYFYTGAFTTTWVRYETTIGRNGQYQFSSFERYFQPGVIMNYNSAAGYSEFQGFRIEEMPDTLDVIRTNAIFNASVGINTTNPTEKLTVAGGNILVDSGRSIYWGNANSQIMFDGTAFRHLIGGSVRARLTSSGLTIGQDLNPSMALDVRGAGNFSGTVFINNNTDLNANLTSIIANLNSINASGSAADDWNLTTNNVYTKDLNYNVSLGIVTTTAKLYVNGTIVGRGSSDNPSLFQLNEYRGGSLVDVSESGDAAVATIGYYGLTGPRISINGGVSNGGSSISLYNNTGSIAALLNSMGSSYFNGGNVGIGTTNPQSILQVNGNITMGGWITNLSNPLAAQDAATKAYVDSATGGTGGVAVWNQSGSNVYLNLLTSKVGIGNLAPKQKLHVSGNLEVGDATASGGGLGIGQGVYPFNGYFNYTDDGTGYGPAFLHTRVNSTGSYQNITPVFWLQTSGDNVKAIVSGDLQLGTTNISALGAYPTVTARTYLAGLPNTNNYINNGGNLGIGTANPLSKLDIVGQNITLTGAANGITAFNIFDSSTSAAGFRIRYDDTVGDTYLDSLYDNAAGDIHIRTKTAGTPVEALFIESAGNVGIGTATPSRALDVRGWGNFSGSVYLNNGTEVLNYINTNIVANNTGGSSNGTSTYVPYVGASKSVSLGVNNLTTTAGRIGIGTTSPITTLHVAGNVTVEGSFPTGGHNMLRNSDLALGDIYWGSVGGYPDYVGTRVIMNDTTVPVRSRNFWRFTVTNTGASGDITGASVQVNNLKLYTDYSISCYVRTTSTVQGYFNVEKHYANWSGREDWPALVWGYTNDGNWTRVGGYFNTTDRPAVTILLRGFTTNGTWDFTGCQMTEGRQISTYQQSPVDAVYIGDAQQHATQYGFSPKLINTFGTATNGYSIYVQAPNGSYTNKYALVTDPNAGNVGIGTLAPSRALDVRGIGNFSGTVYINNGTDINALVSGADDWNVSGTNLFPLSLLYNVGIGTTTPGSTTGMGGQTPKFAVTGYTNLEGLRIRGADTSNTIYSEQGPLAITTNGSPIYLGSSGSGQHLNIVGSKIGIGTTAPNQKLTVNGAANISGNVSIGGTGTIYNNANSAELHLGNALAASGTSGSVSRFAIQPYGHTGGPFKFVARDTASTAYLDINYGSTQGITLDSDGKLGINTTGPTAKFEITGSPTAQTLVAISGSSSTTALSNDGTYLNLVNTGSTTNNFAHIGWSDTVGGSLAAAITGVYTDHTNEYGDLVFQTRSASSGFSPKIRIDGYGNLTLSGGRWINNVSNPLVASDVATKAYVDSATGGAGSAVWSRNAGNVYLNTSTDRVGIGNQTPIDLLQIAATSTPFAQGEYGSMNLIFNGGAEEGTTGWTSYDFGIDTSTGSGGTSTTTPHSGSRYFTGSNDGGWMQAVQLVPNSTYTLSVRIRPNGVDSSDASAGTLMVRWPAANLTSMNCAPNTYDVGPWVNQWSLCSLTFKSPEMANQTNVTIEVGFRAAGSTHTIAVDDITLVKGGLVQEYSPISRTTGALEAIGISARTGIGINNPAYRLEINNATKALNVSGLLYVNGTQVGIGTSNPQAKTQISLSTNTATGYSSNVGLAVSNVQGASSISRLAITSGSQATGGIDFGYDGASTYAVGQINYDNLARAMNFVANSATAVTINGSGFVGIGTTSPSTRLHVVGSSILASTTAINPDSYASSVVAGGIATAGGWTLTSGVGGNAGTGHSWGIGSNGQNLYFGYEDTISANTMQTYMQVLGRNVSLVPSSGNVGIGTTTPSQKLQIGDNSVASLGFRIAATGVNYDVTTDSSGNLNFANGGGTHVTLYRLGNVSFNYGNVGIGTTTPSRALDVRGIGNFSGTVYINNGTDINTLVSGSDEWNLSGSNLFPKDLAYNIGIGTTTPAYKVDVRGDLLLNDTEARLIQYGNVAIGSAAGVQYFYNVQSTDANDEVAFIGAYQGDADGGELRFQTKNGGAWNPGVILDEGGNLGIGTSNPSASYKLEVNGSAKIGGVSQGTVLRIEATDQAGAPASTAYIQLHGYEGRGKGIFITDENDAKQWFIGEGYNYDGIAIGYNDTTAAQAEYAANAKLFIGSNGNVGINTTSPQAKFEVVGDSSHGVRIVTNSTTTNLRLFNNGLGLGQTNALGIDFTPTSGFGPALSAITGGWETSTARGTLAFRTSSDSGATLPERLVILGDGNVGIGTTAPVINLDVQGTNEGVRIGTSFLNSTNSDGTFVIAGVDRNHMIVLRGNDSTTAFDATTYYEYGGTLAAGKGHKFYTGGVVGSQTLKFQVADDGSYFSGNVGIGTAAPSRALDVRGIGNFSGSVYLNNGTEVLNYINTNIVANSSGGNTNQTATYVPYVGASKAVNLGSQTLTTTGSTTTGALYTYGAISGLGFLNQTFSNMKKNAGFESGTADGWTGGGSGSNPNFYSGITTAYSRSGSYSFRISNSSSYCNNYVYENIDVKANTTYSISGWTKTINEGVNGSGAGVFIAQASGTGCTEWSNMIYGSSSLMTGTGDWKQTSVEGWDSGSCTRIRVGFTVQSCSLSGDSYFDDLMITEGNSAKKYSPKPVVDSSTTPQTILGAGLGINTTSSTYGLEINSPNKGLNVSNFLFANATNVGIGTNNPRAALHINSSGQALRLTALTDTSAEYIQFQTSASTGMGYVGVEGSSGGSTFTGTLPYATFLSSGASGTALQLGTAGSVKATILSSGNVGINNSVPTSALHVNGTTRLSFNNSLEFARDQAASDFSTFIGAYNYPGGGYSGSDTNYWLRLQSKGGTHLVLNSDGGAGAAENGFDRFIMWQGLVGGDRLFEVGNTGNTFVRGNFNVSNNFNVVGGKVGIGTNNPSLPFEVYNSTGDTRSVGIHVGNKVTYDAAASNTPGKVVAGINFTWYSGSWQIGAARGGAADIDGLVFGLNGNSMMVIDDNGKVGLNTTAPQAKLHVQGDAIINASATGGNVVIQLG